MAADDECEIEELRTELKEMKAQLNLFQYGDGGERKGVTARLDRIEERLTMTTNVLAWILRLVLGAPLLAAGAWIAERFRSGGGNG